MIEHWVIGVLIFACLLLIYIINGQARDIEWLHNELVREQFANGKWEVKPTSDKDIPLFYDGDDFDIFIDSAEEDKK